MANTESAALRLVVRGRVQGVNFRYFTLGVARDLDLKGWVRNCADGTVEVQVVGPRDDLDRLKDALRRGPSAARVTGLEEEALREAPPWERFEIVY